MVKDLREKNNKATIIVELKSNHDMINFDKVVSRLAEYIEEACAHEEKSTQGNIVGNVSISN